VCLGHDIREGVGQHSLLRKALQVLIINPYLLFYLARLNRLKTRPEDRQHTFVTKDRNPRVVAGEEIPISTAQQAAQPLSVDIRVIQIHVKEFFSLTVCSGSKVEPAHVQERSLRRPGW